MADFRLYSKEIRKSIFSKKKIDEVVKNRKLTRNFFFNFWAPLNFPEIPKTKSVISLPKRGTSKKGTFFLKNKILKDPFPNQFILLQFQQKKCFFEFFHVLGVPKGSLKICFWNFSKIQWLPKM